MRQEPCPAFFLKIGPQAAKVGPGFRSDRRSSGGAESDNVGQARCLPHLGNEIGYISASGACFKDRICSSAAPISPLTQMDRFWMAPGT